MDKSEQAEVALSNKVEDPVKPITTEELDDDPVFSKNEQSDIKRLIDRSLIVITGLMYMIAILDRANLGNAAIAGMSEDLGLGSAIVIDAIKQSLIALVLFITYVLFQPPATLLVRKFGPRFFLPTICLCWGIVTDGVGGYAGWRWIFIIEGLCTCVVSALGAVFMVPFPDQLLEKEKFWPTFLKKEEIEFVVRCINKDRNDAFADVWSWKKWASSGLDPKVWSFALIFIFTNSQGYAVAYFLPIILRQTLGFSLLKAQCLSAPPYVFTAVMTLIVPWIGDHYHIRGPLLAANAVMGLIALPIIGWAKGPAVRYFGTFLVAASGNVATPLGMAYQANNIRGHWKRKFCSATLVGSGAGIGAITGTLIFRSQDAPEYRPRLYGCITCNLLVILFVSINTMYFRHQNRLADKHGEVLEGETSFRYTI
ncbi:uncharacterized protein A1O9_12849 [Exophiala aquamarina CBS 119918]|uniref:Major facilitator superfamily (MFS) profile domain-containing protein n=1 Tax=Exophiala aquamarina CBS 119918 TaxID=1182545 RepID=A0A072NU03_9EURO|nr:uncharacterized protein A1O9_12849 [Exophiala aquamarina CBS 119918]KEF51126.1 hypothetical protein A1O9_12849 [Exophiala aquamarina CBS 119918]